MHIHRDYTPHPPPSAATDHIGFAVEAKWISLPPSKVACPCSGLKRSHLLKLLHKYPDRIRSTDMRELGAKKGRWVIWWPDLHRFLCEEAKMTCVRLKNLDR